MADLSPLRRRMIEDMTVRNLSPATQRSYLYAVTKFSRYFGRAPDRLGLEDVRAFQVHLVSTGISWPALNQTVCALRFFYGVTLERGDVPERISYAREPRKLPVVLSADEVIRFLEAVPSLKGRAALTTAYAAGLRASGTTHLKVTDVDSGRMVIRVEHGKGGKDRNVMLSTQLLAILRTYWRLARPRHWLFPGRDETKPIDVQVLHAACRSACAAADLTKRVTVHTLRHSFATPLLESGTDIRRFLLHTLPDGFHRIRHYGYLANGCRAAKLALCHRLLGDAPAESAAEPPKSKPIPPRPCLHCGGLVVLLGLLPRPSDRSPALREDSS